MKKLLITVLFLCLLVGCTKKGAEAGVGEESVSTVKSELKETVGNNIDNRKGNKYRYENLWTGETEYLDTEVADKKIVLSKIPVEGEKYTHVILAEKSRFVEAVVVRQGFRHMDYDKTKDVIFTVDFEVIDKLGRHYGGIMPYTRNLGKLDTVKPFKSITIRENESYYNGKDYDEDERPYDSYEFSLTFMLDEEIIQDSVSWTYSDYEKYAEEEKQRPYFHDTVKMTSVGNLAFVHNDTDEYYHYSYYDFSVTERGYELLDAAIRNIIYDEFVENGTYANLKALLTEEDAATLLYYFDKKAGMYTIVSMTNRYLENKYGISFREYVDPVKTNPYEKNNRY